MTAEIQKKADQYHHIQPVSESLGMVVKAWLMLEFVGDRPDAACDPILMRGATWLPYRVC